MDSSAKKSQASDAKTAKIIGDNIWVRNWEILINTQTETISLS